MVSNQIELQITKQTHILNDNMAQLFAKNMFQINPTTSINDTASAKIKIEISLRRTQQQHNPFFQNKGTLCNKDAIKQLVQTFLTANSRLKEAEAKLERF